MRRGNSTTCMALGLLGLALAWGCGTEPTPPVSVPISVTVSPPTVSVLTGGSQSFSATVTNDPAAQGVSWRITGCAGGAAACGALSNVTSTTATYTAPAPIPSDAQLGITATSVTDNTKAFTVTVAITAIRVSVSPAAGSVAVNGTRLFAATVENDPTNRGVTWSLTGCTGGAAVCGSLTNITNTTATYVAPATVPTSAVGVTATSVSDNTRSFTATLAITVTGANGQVAFVRTRDGNAEIYVINADGSGQVNLTNNPARDNGQLAWSPDGSRIAFVSRRDGNDEFYVMRADGSDQVNLSNNAALDAGPAWSPDGTKIAFHSDRDGPGQPYIGPFQLYVANADGSGVTRLTHDSASDVEATWSPDGSKIAFASGNSAGVQIRVMNADGSGVVGLTDFQNNQQPAWSPDGSKIAFSSGALKVMNADGTGATTLTTGYYPRWSPEGSKIAFLRENHTPGRLCSQSPCTLSFYVINPDGSGLLRLDHNLFYGSEGDDVGPSWSPDGSRVAFVSTPTAGGASALYVTNADGSGLVDVTQGTGAGYYPAWKPR